MSLFPVVLCSAAVLLAAYRWYGPLIVRWLGVDPARTTPAVALRDGNDFVPAPAPVVLGGHFTAIAAAGPVVGPIVAGLAFGWLPALLWIVVGAILIGGVHDTAALFASIRHKAGSITQVVREHMSRTAYLTFLLFVWISLVYLIIAFADVTAGTFAAFQRYDATGSDAGGSAFSVNGGAVVVGAAGYLLLSIASGALVRFTRVPWQLILAGAVVALTAIVWNSPAVAQSLAGYGLAFMDTRGADASFLQRNWNMALLAYCFVASVTPMWLLLQPRGVIGATFLYAALGFGVIGSFVGAVVGDSSLRITWPAFSGFFGDGATAKGLAGAPLFPFLFITIACGACSGFHSIVATGTTSKQVRCEGDVRAIGYGAMLLEALVALFALSCVMVMSPGTTGKPDFIYARGIGNFMRICHIPMAFGVTFGLLAFSSFVFDTLDVCTRLGRYVLQEITGLKGMSGGAIATLVTIGGPALYLWLNPPGKFMTFWVIFGTSNQLLAALTLVGVSTWLWRTGRPVWFTLLPGAFMALCTAAALAMNFRSFWLRYHALAGDAVRSEGGSLLTNMAIAVLLFVLGAVVLTEALRVWRAIRRTPAPVVPALAAARLSTE